MTEDHTTLAVSREVAALVKAAAARAKLSMYEYVNTALRHFVTSADVAINVKEKEDA